MERIPSEDRSLHSYDQLPEHNRLSLQAQYLAAGTQAKLAAERAQLEKVGMSRSQVDARLQPMQTMFDRQNAVTRIFQDLPEGVPIKQGIVSARDKLNQQKKQPGMSPGTLKEIDGRIALLREAAHFRPIDRRKDQGFAQWLVRQSEGEKSKAEQKPREALPPLPVGPSAQERAQVAHQDRGQAERLRSKLEEESQLETVLVSGLFAVHTSLPSEAGKRAAGFQDVYDERGASRATSFPKNFAIDSLQLRSERTAGEKRNSLVNQGISEVVMLTPMTRRVYKTVEIQQTRSGFLGALGMKERVTQQVQDGPPQPIRMSELIPGSEDEPCCLLTYETVNMDYMDYSGRRGNILSIKIMLPQSVAQKILALGKADPRIFRRLAEKVGREKMGLEIHPPYETWDAQAASRGGAKMFIQDLSMDQAAKAVSKNEVYPL